VILILFGVSGAGKTTIGRLLATNLCWKFYDADDFHPQTSIARMRKGVALTEQERWPWLHNLRDLIEQQLTAKENAVLACSALRKTYRQYLRVSEEVQFVYLRGSYELIANQIQQRRGHFMDPALLRSQFETFEEPEPTDGVLTIDLGRPSEELVDEIREKLLLKAQGGAG
jgi:gluconokinase